VNTRLPIEELVEIILRRSVCRVQMGAVIYDSHGVFAWGWNHAGENGLGEHAEVHAMRRANKRRLAGATLVVAGRYRKSRGIVEAKPCGLCLGMALDKGLGRVVYRGSDGVWRAIRLAGQGVVEKS
jgi:tRNA(Arg) A34 adenosine deaminase TadA